jgi:hypothetical protein
MKDMQSLQGSWCCSRGRNAFSSVSCRPGLAPTVPAIRWVPASVSLGVKRHGREADHSPPSGGEVEKGGAHRTSHGLAPAVPGVRWVPASVFPGAMQHGREADHSPPSGGELRRVAWCFIN